MFIAIALTASLGCLNVEATWFSQERCVMYSQNFCKETTLIGTGISPLMIITVARTPSDYV